MSEEQIKFLIIGAFIGGVITALIGLIFWLIKRWITNKSIKKDSINNRREPIYSKIITLLTPLTSALSLHCRGLNDKSRDKVDKLFSDLNIYLQSIDHELSVEIKSIIDTYHQEMVVIIPQLSTYQNKLDIIQSVNNPDARLSAEIKAASDNYDRISNQIENNRFFYKLLDDIKQQALKERS